MISITIRIKKLEATNIIVKNPKHVAMFVGHRPFFFKLKGGINVFQDDDFTLYTFQLDKFRETFNHHKIVLPLGYAYSFKIRKSYRNGYFMSKLKVPNPLAVDSVGVFSADFIGLLFVEQGWIKLASGAFIPKIELHISDMPTDLPITEPITSNI